MSDLKDQSSFEFEQQQQQASAAAALPSSSSSSSLKRIDQFFTKINKNNSNANNDNKSVTSFVNECPICGESLNGDKEFLDYHVNSCLDSK